jgi:hypothetical protein
MATLVWAMARQSRPDPRNDSVISNIHVDSTTQLSPAPDSRHKSRNAGQVFATNHETKIFAAK